MENMDINIDSTSSNDVEIVNDCSDGQCTIKVD